VQVPPPPPNVEVRECPPKGTACEPGLPLWCTLDKRLAIFTCEGGKDRPSYLRPLAIEGDITCSEPTPPRPVPDKPAPPRPEPACSRVQVPPPPPNVEVRECPPKGTACEPGIPLWCTLDKRLAIFTCDTAKGAPGVLVPRAIEGDVQCDRPEPPRPGRDCAATCEAKLRPAFEDCLARAKEPRDRGVCGDPAFQSAIARCLEACGDGACAGAEGKGTYEGALCSTGGGIRTKEIACRDAHANCLVNAWSSPGSDMSCRWEDRGLRKGSCAPVVPTPAPPRR
jgi:hypothetical protein